jgi:hypothetical protein
MRSDAGVSEDEQDNLAELKNLGFGHDDMFKEY